MESVPCKSHGMFKEVKILRLYVYIVKVTLAPIWPSPQKHWSTYDGVCSLQVSWQCEVVQGSYNL